MIIFTLLRLFLVVVVVYLVYRWLWPGKKPGTAKAKRRATVGQIEEMKKDPVCGTYVPESQALTAKIDKQTYFFCSETCKKKFLELRK